MRLLISLFLSLALSACLTNGKRGNESAPAIYDLGAPAKMPLSGPLTATAIEVRAPLWLDTMGIDYRLLYADSARLREYGRARWAGPPTQLIERRLAQRLGSLPAGQGRSSCLLRLEISEFSQLFDTPERSRGVLRGQVNLLDKARSVLASREIFIEKNAPSADSAGGVIALTATVEQLSVDLPAWEKSLRADQRTADCTR